MSSRYAKQTTVSVSKSVEELKKIIRQYGGGEIVYAESEEMAAIGFKKGERSIKYQISLPPKDDKLYTHTESKGLERHPVDAHKLWERDCRQRWRVLVLLVKATFEAIENGLMSFEQAFMSSIVMRNGQTLGDRFLPELDKVIETGKLPLMITAGGK